MGKEDYYERKYRKLYEETERKNAFLSGCLPLFLIIIVLLLFSLTLSFL